MEFVRIFSRKKFLIMIVVLLLINFAYYIKTQNDAILYASVSTREITRLRTDLLHEYSSMTVKEAYQKNTERFNEISILSRLSMYHIAKEQQMEEYNEIYASIEISLRNEYPDLAQKYDSNPVLYTEEYFYIYNNVLSALQKRQEYIIGYSDNIKKIKEQAKNSNTISIFNTNSSFSQKNIDKTVEDYQRIAGVQLKSGNDEVLTSIVKYDVVQYLILIFILFLMLGFLTERKTGLWNSIYSTKNGRKQLALRRCGILSISIVFINALMYASVLLMSVMMYGDWNDLLRNVQSIEMFGGFTTPMTVIGFFLWFVAIKIIISLAVAFFVWLVFSLSYHLNIGIAVVGLSLSVEWMLYNYLPVQSSFNILKYVNLFCYINVSQDIIKYRNISFFTLAISRTALILVSSIVLFSILMILCVLVNEKKKPFQSYQLTEKIHSKCLSQLSIIFHKVVESLHITGLEIYKIFYTQKGILILIALCYLLFSGISSITMYYSPSDYIVNDFYKEYSGIPTKESSDYIENLRAEISTTEKEYSDAYAKYQKGELSYAELDGFKYILNANENKTKALLKIDKSQQYINELDKNSSIKGWFINQRAYDYLFGEKGYSSQIKYALYAILCLILLLSSVFSYEYKSNTKKLLHSTVNGRKYLFYKKIKCANIIVIVVWLLVYGFEILNINQIYGITCLGAPVQSLQMMSGYVFPCSIGTFILLVNGIRLIMLLAISYVICYLSICMPQSICLVVLSILFLLPAILSILGIEFFKYLSFAQGMVMMRNVFQSNQPGLGVIPSLIIMTIGGISFCLAKSRWSKTVKKSGGIIK